MSFYSWLGIRRTASRRANAGGKARHTCRLHVEPLEDRCMPASGLSASLVADIVPGTVSSNPSGLTSENGTLYFSAAGGLWKSDGTPAGTVLVKAGVGGSPFTPLNGSVLFLGGGEQSNSGLWKTDGTAAGTVFLKPFRFAEGPLFAANGKVFFSADDGNSGSELWVSDGTAAGTSLVKDIYGGKINYPGDDGHGHGTSVPHGSYPRQMIDVNGTLFFTAEDGKTGRELWKSDGTARGTTIVKDITKGTDSSNPLPRTAVNGVLYFGAANPAGGLWRTDGTASGTVLVKSGMLVSMANVNETLYFGIEDAALGHELWKSDGTPAGTVLVKDIVPGSSSSVPSGLVNVNGTLFFNASGPDGGRELWKSDGTDAGTVLVKDINPGSAASNPLYLTNVNGLLYFNANDGTNGKELWQSDGTAAGTVMVQDIYPGSTSSDPAYLVAMNNKLYFAATDPEHGRELWDPPAAGGSGMSLVGNWHEHGHLYADLWAEEITSGRFKGRTFAYLGHYASQGGVDIIDITNPSAPTLASTFVGTGGDNELVDVQVQNGIGYFGSNHNTAGGIYIVDVSNPYAPRQLARIDPSNGGFAKVHTLFVDGRYLYEVANRFFPGINVFDVSNPAHPAFVRNIPTPSGDGIHEVTVRNGRLYTANIHVDSGGEVDIFDVSNVGDLTRPVPLLGSFKAAGETHTSLSTEDGQFLIVTKEWPGQPMEIYNISDPAAPKLASTIHLPRKEALAAHQPMIVGNLLYVSWYEAGVRVYNIADPYHPVFVGDYDTYTGPYGEEDECAGLGGHAAGVNSDVEPGLGPLPCGAWGVYPFLGNDRILVSDFDRGLFIVSLDNPPQALTAAASAPAPVNETLSADLAQPLLTEALARWQRGGVAHSILSTIGIRIADLPGETLGQALGQTIWLDANAAGWGWFVDPTPRDDSEFTTPGNQGEQHRMDLLTVLAHEIGHLLGQEHAVDGVMTDTLATGIRCMPGGTEVNDWPAIVDVLFSEPLSKHRW